MKIYLDKAKGKSYFYYFGWTILVFLAGFFLIFFLIFQARYYVKRTERIEFFIAAHGLKENDIDSKMQKAFEEDGLKEVFVYSYLEDDTNIYNYFSANGENADFVVFSETNVRDMQDYVPSNYFDVTTLSNDVPSILKYDLLQIEGGSYAIKIFDGASEEYNSKYIFSDWIEFTKEGKENESYYLLIDNHSPNFDKQKNNIFGYKTLEYLLSEMVKPVQ